MLATYHSHCYFCDGALTPEDYIMSAIQKGFAALGFSSHAPVHFYTSWNMKAEKLLEYLQLIGELKEKYRGKIQIYSGLETDYYPGCRDYRGLPGLDYNIGSIHFIHDDKTDRYMPMDGTAEQFLETRDDVFGGNIQALIERFYELTMIMVETQTPDIVGHLDVLKKNNTGSRFFNESESWYRNIVIRTLETIKKHDCIVEINTGGIARGYTTEIYPSRWILELMREMDIPAMINSDAHHPDHIDCCYREAAEAAKSAGYSTQRILLDGVWQDVPLD